MLHEHGMVLLVDSNLLAKILPRGGDMSNIYGALAGRIADTPRKAGQRPVGKTVTLLVTTAIFRDYRTGFGRNKYDIDAHAWARFKKSINKRRLVGCNAYFTICKIEPSGGGRTEWRQRRWQGDKYDKAYFEALKAAIDTERFKDRHIVFASADRATSSRMAEEFPALSCDGRLHIVDSRDSLDGLIMD